MLTIAFPIVIFSMSNIQSKPKARKVLRFIVIVYGGSTIHSDLLCGYERQGKMWKKKCLLISF